MWFLLFLLMIFVLYILRFYYDLIRAFFLSLKINGPPALPIIGNGLLFINNTSAGNSDKGRVKKISTKLRTLSMQIIIFLNWNFSTHIQSIPKKIVTESVWFTAKNVLSVFPTENFRVGTGLLKKYGEFYRIWIGIELSIIIQEPNDVEVSETLLKKNHSSKCLRLFQILLTSPRYIDKSSEYEFIRPWLNEGLLLSTGNQNWILMEKHT